METENPLCISLFLDFQKIWILNITSCCCCNFCGCWLNLEKLRKAVHLQLPACKETVIIASKVSADLKVLHYFCTELYCTDFSFWYKQVTSQASTALPSPCSPLQQGNTDGQHGLPAAQLGQQLGQAGKEGGHGYSSYITKYPDNLALTEVQMASFIPMKTLIV